MYRDPLASVGSLVAGRLRKSRALLLVLGAVSADPVQARQEPVPAPPPSSPVVQSALQPDAPATAHQQMLALLKEIADRTADENPWLGDKPTRELRLKLAELPVRAPALRRHKLQRRLGNEELRLGNNEQAIKLHAAACELLPDVASQLSADEYRDALFDLGVAYMRLGETQNCVQRHCCQSCILPIERSAIHQHPDGSKGAIKAFMQLLEKYPSDLAAGWLLNIAHMTLGSYPEGVPERFRISPRTFDSEEEFPRFTDVATDLGLNTFELSGGVIADDFDNDGDLDLVTSTSNTRGEMHYFRNRGDGTFEDQTAAVGLSGLLGGLNMVQADYDNDGNVDILVLRGAWLGEFGRHPNSLIRNHGHGTFSDVTLPAGLAMANYPSQTAAWADYDNDGDLDVYVGNENKEGLNYPNQLFRNEGNGTFMDVAETAGVQSFTYTKGVVFGDYDGDRFPDLFVSHMIGPNRLYHNNGDGTFTDVAADKGAAEPIRSFPAWFWDYNNDGALDLYVSSYWPQLSVIAASYLGAPHGGEPARLLEGDGHGGFRNVTTQQNLQKVVAPMGANFGDLDNDGYPDMYLGTGFPGYEGLMPNVMYHNRRGKGFADVTTAAGVGHLQKGHGIAFADIDADGDQDIVAQMGGAYPGDGFTDAVFQNPGFGNHWIKVRLVGVRSNRSAIGARVRVEIVEDGKRRSIYSHVNSGGSFGANPLRREIGLGQAGRVELLEVYWPTTNLTQTFRNVAAGQFIEIEEGKDQLRVVPPPTVR